MSDTVVMTKIKCKKHNVNYILTVAGWRCPNCVIEEHKTKGQG